MKIRTSRQIAGHLAAAIMIALAAAPNAFAQEADDDSAQLDRVEVTGSRIRQAQIEGVSPVLVLDREDIDRTGLTSVGDILQQLTISGSAINTRFNSSGNFGFPPDGGGIGAGAVQVDMRHLDANRTLVLVNGKRWINGASASGVSSAVDLNTIPINIVERIEVLTDGANAIYGADAIAGVINIITRSDFSGVEARGYYGEFDEGDGEVGEAELTIGKDLDEAHFVMSVGYANHEEVFARDRELSQFPVPGTGLTRGSSGTPQGRFVFFDPNTGELINATLNDGVIDPMYDPANPNGGDYHGFTNNDRFNFAPLNLYITPSERVNFFTEASIDITDNTQFYLRGVYNNRKSTNQAAPEPIFIGPGAETGSIADDIIISATNPYNPFGFDIFASQDDVDAGAFIGRRPLEAGPRVFKQDVDTFFVTGGLTGEFVLADNPWIWDVSFSWGRNSAEQRKTGALNARHISMALGPVDECEADISCVPLNIFGGQGAGGGTITPEMLSYIGFVQNDKSENEFTDFNASITGDLFELPAGPLGVALGYEHRDLEGFFQPDSVVAAGDSMGVPSSPTEGGYDTDEVFLELNVPLLSGQPGAELLDVSLAARWQDFSTFGSDVTPKFGVRYMPTTGLMFRGSWSEGIRAPGIGELFGTQSRFDAVLSDPCANTMTPSANCQALGVPAGGFEQINPQISILTGGNPNLQPEESDTFTVGMVWSPQFVDNADWVSALNFEVNYYDIELDGAIQAVDAQFQLNQCVATLDPAFCNGITRSPSGAISSFQNTLTNIGAIETSGFDFNASYSSEPFGWGLLLFEWENTIVSDYTEINPDGSERQLEGIEENDSAIPEWQSIFTTVLSFNSGWRFNWRIRYIDEITESCSDFLDGSPNSLTALGLCSNPVPSNEALSTNDLDSTVYHDLSLEFPVWHDIQFELGVNNAFDEDPPICLSCSLNGYDPSTYDPEGAFWYVRATWLMP